MSQKTLLRLGVFMSIAIGFVLDIGFELAAGN